MNHRYRAKNEPVEVPIILGETKVRTLLAAGRPLVWIRERFACRLVGGFIKIRYPNDSKRRGPGATFRLVPDGSEIADRFRTGTYKTWDATFMPRAFSRLTIQAGKVALAKDLQNLESADNTSTARAAAKSGKENSSDPIANGQSRELPLTLSCNSPPGRGAQQLQKFTNTPSVAGPAATSPVGPAARDTPTAVADL